MKRMLTCLFVLFMIKGYAQPDMQSQAVANRLFEFYSAAPVEKVYLHQDRTHYVAGETLWFKAYQSSTEQAAESGVLYVELINGNNERVVESKWRIFNGRTSGQIELPESLPMGTYQLRAYTHWMQNLYPNGFFTREIQVASHYMAPLEVETDFEVEGGKLHAALRLTPVPQGKVAYRLMLNGGTTKAYALQPDTDGEVLLDVDLPKGIEFEGPQYFIVETEQDTLTFPIPFMPPVQLYLFPEGGNLVADMLSKVAFKVTDRLGHGVEATGVVLDAAGNEINRIETTHQGNGFFLITPEANTRYTVRLDNSAVEAVLPEVHTEGVVVSLRRWDDMVRVVVASHFESYDSPLYLAIHQEGIHWLNARIEREEEMAVLDIPVSELPVGVFTLTVYDNQDRAWSERLAFVNYPDQLELQLQTDKTTYGRREKVTLTVDSPVDDLNYGDYSLAVVKSTLEPTTGYDNYYTNYFLQSELKGRIDNPMTYFEDRDYDGWQNLDLLLLTNGWRRYDWQQMMHAESYKPAYPVEERLTFSGQVHLQNKRQKPEDITLSAVFRHPEIDDLHAFHPGEDGVFYFTGYDFAGTAEVILSAIDNRNETTFDLSIFDHAGSPPHFYTYSRGLSKAANNSLFVEMSGAFIQHVAKDIDKTIFDLPEIAVTARKRTKPVTSHRLHSRDLVHTPLVVNKQISYGGSLLHLLYTVPGLRVQESPGGEWSVTVRGTTRAVTGPVYILNGSRTNKEAISTLSPGIIERIEVLSPAAAMLYSQDTGGGGIAFYTNSLAEVDASPTKTLMHHFAGYNQKKEFFSPDYAVANTTGYQDFDRRNTLYWQPEVTMNNSEAQVSFYTSDEKGTYTIHCEGRSTEGIIGAASYTFTVE